MAIDSDRRKLLLLLALLALATLAGCSETSPPMCWSCDQGIDDAVSNGPDVPVTSTELEIRLLSDGDARWHVRAELNSTTAARLEANRSRLQRIGERAVYGDEPGDRRSSIEVDRISNVSTRLENDTLHIRFRVDGFAEQRRGGLLFVDAFQSRGEADAFDVGADRLVLRGPNGTVLVNDPPSTDASPDARTLVWTDARGVSKNVYVVYSEDDGFTERALAQGYIAADVLGRVGPRLLPTIPFVVTWAAVVLALQGVANRSRDEPAFPNPSGLVSLRFAATIGLLAFLTGYVIATGTRLPLWVGWLPTLPLLLFGAHGLAVAVDSDWRRELAACLAAVPLLTMASIAGVPSAQNFQVAVVVDLTVLTISGLGIGAVVWGLAYALYGDTVEEALR